MAELVPDSEETDEVSEAQGSPLRQRKNRKGKGKGRLPNKSIFKQNGPSELESSFSSFINNTEVRRAFSRSLLQHFPRQFTCDFTFFFGNSKIIWGRRECQPSWWPQTIAFLDPNNAGKKEMRGDDLVVVMNAYGKHQMQEQQTQPQQQGATIESSSLFYYNQKTKTEANVT
ncbi:hypothetical protein P5673_005523 [Acropora cervicornis]|uniref:Uncharacterized protein n=1 Tax=Acropora cervicornis TaxID=6130 RepID=A0AAD9VCP3_ACRCE|nr:hypothetical protein P5673_005523 [Acropora cervicornis]